MTELDVNAPSKQDSTRTGVQPAIIATTAPSSSRRVQLRLRTLTQKAILAVRSVEPVSRRRYRNCLSPTEMPGSTARRLSHEPHPRRAGVGLAWGTSQAQALARSPCRRQVLPGDHRRLLLVLLVEQAHCHDGLDEVRLDPNRTLLGPVCNLRSSLQQLRPAAASLSRPVEVAYSPPKSHSCRPFRRCRSHAPLRNCLSPTANARIDSPAASRLSHEPHPRRAGVGLAAPWGTFLAGLLARHCPTVDSGLQGMGQLGEVHDRFVVRRAKAPFLSGCESRPATVVPAGSSRSGRWRQRHRLKHSDDTGRHWAAQRPCGPQRE